MSEEGYKQLIEELKYLESVERPKIVSAIAEARDKGCLLYTSNYVPARTPVYLIDPKQVPIASGRKVHVIQKGACTRKGNV